MIRNNLAVKIGLSVIALIFAVTVAQYVALGQLLRSAVYQQSGQELVHQGQQYANMSSMGGSMMIQMLCATAGVPMVMVSSNGKVIAASPSLHTQTPDWADQTALMAALSGQTGIHSGISGLFEQSGIMVAVPILRGGHVDGAVALFRPDGIVQTAFRHVEWLLVLAGAGGMLVAIGLTVIVTNRIASPLGQMARVAKDMSKGNYAARVPVIGEDEVGKLGQAINELAANLKRLDTSRREFLADVSHELRTPMSYIRGYSQVLAEGLVPSPEEASDYLKTIHDESIRLEGLVNDLFVLAQADAGILQVDKKPVDLQGIIEGVLDRMSKRAQEKQIDLRASLNPLQSIEADAARLKQVLVNLIDNTIRHTPERGYIEVRLKRVANEAEIRVSDTGIGIPSEELPHIWERLYRVEKSRSRSGGGTGLGLAIVKQIVEAHDGSVYAESVEKVGTVISFRIPYQQTDRA